MASREWLPEWEPLLLPRLRKKAEDVVQEKTRSDAAVKGMIGPLVSNNDDVAGALLRLCKAFVTVQPVDGLPVKTNDAVRAGDLHRVIRIQRRRPCSVPLFVWDTAAYLIVPTAWADPKEETPTRTIASRENTFFFSNQRAKTTMMRAAIPTKALVLDMCRLSALAYRDQPAMTRAYDEGQESCLRVCGACPRLIENDEAGNDGQAYVGAYNGDHLLVFRGTEGFRDWLSDFNVVRVRMSVDTLTMADEPLVHFGFIRQYRTLEDKIHDFLGPCPSGTLHVSGHSLGGALATVACVFSCTSGTPNWTYGATLSEAHGQETPPSPPSSRSRCLPRTVFFTKRTPVTATPTTWRYQHVCGGRWICQDGTVDDEARMGHVSRFFRILKHGFLSLFGLTERGLGEFHSIDKYYTDIDERWNGE